MIGRGTNFIDAVSEQHERAERRWRAFFGFAVLMALGWSALLAVLVIAAARWLFTH
jgi:hypothetical protein